MSAFSRHRPFNYLGTVIFPCFVIAYPAQKSRIQVMLYDNTDMRIEGRLIVRPPPAAPHQHFPWEFPSSLVPHRCPTSSSFVLFAQGFDEYMNIVLEDAEEISLKRKTRKSLGALVLPSHWVAYRTRNHSLIFSFSFHSHHSSQFSSSSFILISSSFLTISFLLVSHCIVCP